MQRKPNRTLKFEALWLEVYCSASNYIFDMIFCKLSCEFFWCDYVMKMSNDLSISELLWIRVHDSGSDFLLLMMSCELSYG